MYFKFYLNFHASIHFFLHCCFYFHLNEKTTKQTYKNEDLWFYIFLYKNNWRWCFAFRIFNTFDSFEKKNNVMPAFESDVHHDLGRNDRHSIRSFNWESFQWMISLILIMSIGKCTEINEMAKLLRRMSSETFIP